MSSGVVFTDWDDTVQTYLQTQLRRTDFKIKRPKLTSGYRVHAAATILSGRILVEGYPLSGDRMAKLGSDALVAYIRDWATQMIQTLRRATEQFPEDLDNYFLEIVPSEDGRGKSLQMLLIRGELTARPLASAVALSEVGFEGGVYKTGREQFWFLYTSPDTVWRRIRQFVLWERRRSLVEGIVEGRVRLLSSEGLEGFSEIEILARAASSQRYNHFFIYTEGRGMWLLRHPRWGFWRTQQTPVETVGVWSAEDLAYLYADACRLEGFEAEYIQWEDWEFWVLPEWRRIGAHVEVNAVPNDSGERVSLETFVQDATTARESLALGLLPKLSVPGSWVAVLGD